MPDVVGMFLAGMGLPSQLEQEDYFTLMAAQERYIKQQEDAEMKAWASQVRASWKR